VREAVTNKAKRTQDLRDELVRVARLVKTFPAVYGTRVSLQRPYRPAIEYYLQPNEYKPHTYSQILIIHIYTTRKISASNGDKSGSYTFLGLDAV
jgi:hypothetical protein